MRKENVINCLPSEDLYKLKSAQKSNFSAEYWAFSLASEFIAVLILSSMYILQIIIFMQTQMKSKSIKYSWTDSTFKATIKSDILILELVIKEGRKEMLAKKTYTLPDLPKLLDIGVRHIREVYDYFNSENKFWIDAERAAIVVSVDAAMEQEEIIFNLERVESQVRDEEGSVQGGSKNSDESEFGSTIKKVAGEVTSMRKE